MGLLGDLGVGDLGIKAPSVNISGFLANSWGYIFVIGLIGFILIATIGALLFFSTYKKKIVIFENIAGKNYQPVLKTRARTIKLGTGGVEVLKTLKGSQIISAYGRKMGKNTYWFAKAEDGYLYNFILADLDAKRATLDIDPIDRDVRMFHSGIAKQAESTYNKVGFMQKYGIHMLMIVAIIIMMVGLYLTAGQIKEGLQAQNNPEQAQINKETLQLASQVLSKIDAVQRGGTSGLTPTTQTSSGLVPVE